MGLEDHADFGRVVGEYGGTLDDILEHYGIRGMKWGVRRSRKQIDDSPDAEEHVRARQLHSVARTAGTRKLSNKDLEDLNKRLNLEQNYSNLNTKKKKVTVANGAAWFGGKVLKIGDMAIDEVAKAHLRVAMIQKGVMPSNGGKG